MDFVTTSEPLRHFVHGTGAAVTAIAIDHRKGNSKALGFHSR
jgi:hypothetical protein